MTINDMDFFHQATMRICGSLDINTVLAECLDYFKTILPANAINMNIHDKEIDAIRDLAMISDIEFHGNRLQGPVPLDQEALDFIKENSGPGVHIINTPETHPIGRLVHKSMGKPDASYLVLHLIIEGEKLGVVALMANGPDRYNEEHARLFSLLHEPFAIAISNTLKHQEVLRLKDLLTDDNRYLNKELHHIAGDEIIGQKFGLKDVMDMVHQVAPLSSQVLLLGETGVGKEVIANAIHYSSPRATGPFIKVNCGAIPESLIDSELFGHEKGAFTGANERKRGRFERADTGTIFLDEIGELPLQAQIRLLRVIQTKEIERVGGTKPIPVDIRIIAATHRNLEEMIKSQKFREDLWFRLNVFPITIPPLRHRTMDIPALVHYFVERKSKEMNIHPKKTPTQTSIEKLQSYGWPGNVRELENVIERALIRSAASGLSSVLIFDEPEKNVPRTIAPVIAAETQGVESLDKIVKQHIETALQVTNGKVKGENGAAALLGLNPSTLRNRMTKLGIDYGRQSVVR